MLKSIGVVVGSYVLSVILVLAADPLLSRLFPDYVRGQVPSTPPLITSTVFFFIVAILCAWICARFAPRRAERHVLWLFIVGEVMGIISIIPNWNNGWPHWYWISWLLLWPAGCLLGLQLARRRAAKAV